MSNSLDGMVAFITGGSTGLGLSHARVQMIRALKERLRQEQELAQAS